ncbi:MAG: hypothetical protein HRT90_00310 [Candidatus Margulisbacteria bacterium]|nr:hypothetical protein [Candidatus Margulisiibacteriota bacterium]
MDNRYSEWFTISEIEDHSSIFSSLGPHQPFHLKWKQKGQGISLTILGFNYPYLFSLLTGLLSGNYFDIVTGMVFTIKPEQSKKDRVYIVDQFSGVISQNIEWSAWVNQFKEQLGTLISYLEKGFRINDAKQMVNALVAKRLNAQLTQKTPMFPMSLSIDNSLHSFTRLSIVTQDTTAFLYMLSNALSSKGISIEQVAIKTYGITVKDTMDCTDKEGQKITDPSEINQLKLFVMLTKQFSSFLGATPDAFAALSRFETMLTDVLKMSEKKQWLQLLKTPQALQELARVLGTSHFLWEDFIRLQYEELIPILNPPSQDSKAIFSKQRTKELLLREVEKCRSLSEKKVTVNQFKDHTIFKIDLAHIINKMHFSVFSKQLTALASVTVTTSLEIVYQDLIAKYGRPRNKKKRRVPFAIFGLGKLGGSALGYASDIELMLVYGGHGCTDGKNSVPNGIFFDQLVESLRSFIDTKQAGIFKVDLRLRPYGDSGPKGVHIDVFKKYFSEGLSLAYEKLALIQLRFIGGSRPLGKRVEQIRDECVYHKPLDISSVWELRKKQSSTHFKLGYINAKYSPGALVDIEYMVQSQQALHGKKVPSLKTPSLRKALRILRQSGIFTPQDADRIIMSYQFYRKLINALRMLRGDANDLFLPSIEALEYHHLAKRMGYQTQGKSEPSQQLFADLEVHLALIRNIIMRYMSMDSYYLNTGNVVDIIVSDFSGKLLNRTILKGYGFKQYKQSEKNLSRMSQNEQNSLFFKAMVLAFEKLRDTPNPDMALNNWERFLDQLSDKKAHFRQMVNQPQDLDILLCICSSSDFLSSIIINEPDNFKWVCQPDRLYRQVTKKELERELNRASASITDSKSWLSYIRCFRKREVLRIGLRDMYLKWSMEDIIIELSQLAEALISVVMNRLWEAHQMGESMPLVLIAVGKLGGNELNYSSDIDLMAVMDGDVESDKKRILVSIVQDLGRVLSSYTEDGYVYRVDFRLRPYGKSGELIYTIPQLLAYYQTKASIWEIQSLIKSYPVSGDFRIGITFLQQLRPILLTRAKTGDIMTSIRKLRQSAVSKLKDRSCIDIKNGVGGIRDIEFLVQGLQLKHAEAHPHLLKKSTLYGLRSLAKTGILSIETSEKLITHYIFLRRVEHCLQLLEDRQTHRLPKDQNSLLALAKRVMREHTSVHHFMSELNRCLEEVRNLFNKCVLR